MKLFEMLPLPQRVAVLTFAIGAICITALMIARVPGVSIEVLIGVILYGAKSPLFPAIPSMTIPMQQGGPTPIISMAPPPPGPSMPPPAASLPVILEPPPPRDE
jgi:hypothetical protein